MTDHDQVSNQFERRDEKHAVFSDTFTRFFAISLALLTVYSVVLLSLKQSAVPGTVMPTDIPATAYIPPSSITNQGGNTSTAFNQNGAGTTSVPSNSSNNGSAVYPLPSTSIESKTPETAAEIVALYKAANEKAKAGAVSVTHLYDNATNYEGIVEAGSLSALGTWAMNTFMKEDSTETVYSSHDDIIKNLPVGGTDKCNLTAEMVDMTKTKCVDNGKEYEVTITVNSSDENPDVNPTRGGGKAGTIGSVLTMEQITDPIKGKLTLSGVECRYSAASVTAKIDKVTGNLLYVETDLPMILYIANAKAGLLSVDGARIGLEFTEKWSVQW